MGILNSIDEAIGGTPLVRLQSATDDHAELVAKLEYQNPGGSVKDRLALGVIQAAEREGLLKPGDLIVEGTSGNTGIGLAMLCAARGYRLILTMPETMSMERRKLLLAYGAELVLTPGPKGMRGANAKAVEIAKERGGFLTKQFDNPANVEVHYRTTGPELLRDTDGALSAIVIGVGTGGTLGGAGKFLKEKIPGIQVVAVEPADSPVLSGGAPGPHKIQGIGAGFVPSVLDTQLIDRVIAVSLDDALSTARELGRKHGILTGISSGANVWAAKQVAKDLAAKAGSGNGIRVAVIIPSNGERYLSSVLYQDVGAIAESLETQPVEL